MSEATRVSNGTARSKRPPLFEDRTDICPTYFLSALLADFTLSFSLRIWTQIDAHACARVYISLTSSLSAHDLFIIQSILYLLFILSLSPDKIFPSKWDNLHILSIVRLMFATMVKVFEENVKW